MLNKRNNGTCRCAAHQATSDDELQSPMRPIVIQNTYTEHFGHTPDKYENAHVIFIPLIYLRTPPICMTYTSNLYAIHLLFVMYDVHSVMYREVKDVASEKTKRRHLIHQNLALLRREMHMSATPRMNKRDEQISAFPASNDVQFVFELQSTVV